MIHKIVEDTVFENLENTTNFYLDLFILNLLIFLNLTIWNY